MNAPAPHPPSGPSPAPGKAPAPEEPTTAVSPGGPTAPAASARKASPRWRAGADLALGLVPLAAICGATWRFFALPASYLAVAGALYAVLAATILASLPRALPGPGLGPANRITLGRGLLVVAISGLVAYPGTLSGSPGAVGGAVAGSTVAGGASSALLPWWVIALATLSMVLDGFDGWVARKTGTETGFGARFDMELDAFLMLVLSVLLWGTGKVGAWVLLIGLLRYLFVAAGWAWGRLRGELFPSFRRKAVCVVQGVALLVALGPIIPAQVAGWVAAGALAALVWSFGVDVVWLARGVRAAHRASPTARRANKR